MLKYYKRSVLIYFCPNVRFRIKQFPLYFKKVWLSPKRRGWYEGFLSAIPNHNNYNEADNRYIKEDQDRKRLGLIQREDKRHFLFG